MTAPYVDEIQKVIARFDPPRSNRYFLFGSSVRKDRFHDMDLGVVGNKQSQKQLSGLRDYLYDAPIPYKIDVVDFDEADAEFRDHVMKNETLVWIR